MKHYFFQAVIMSILLYGCTTWTLTKRMEKELDGNYTRMLRAILNKSWRQHPTNSSYMATYHPSRKLSKLDKSDMRDTAGNVGTSSWVIYSCGPLHMDKQRQDIQFEPTYSSCANTGYSPGDLPKAMDDREEWQERVRNIHTDSVTWWWWLETKCVLELNNW